MAGFKCLPRGFVVATLKFGADTGLLAQLHGRETQVLHYSQFVLDPFSDKKVAQCLELRLCINGPTFDFSLSREVDDRRQRAQMIQR